MLRLTTKFALKTRTLVKFAAFNMSEYSKSDFEDDDAFSQFTSSLEYR